MAITGVRMPDELLAQLEQAAVKLRRSKGWIINHWVKEYLDREAHKSQILEETLEALADLKAGRTVDGAGVMDWLESLGTESEQAPPKR